MWKVRGYTPKDNELAGEWEVHIPHEIGDVLGYEPSPYGATPLFWDDARYLINGSLDQQDVYCFLVRDPNVDLKG